MVALLVVLRLHGDKDRTAELALEARRVDLVDRMQLDLASASEAEKSAVLATTDQDSQTFADQARAASAKVEQERRELGELLTGGEREGERESLAQFSAAFAELQRIDDDLLALAVKNTNVKAYGLAFGPAAAAVQEMSAALDCLVAANGDVRDSTLPTTVMRLAYGAQTSALRIQTLLPPHIAEENDKKMDELEAQMATEDARVRKSLDGLAALPKLSKEPDSCNRHCALRRVQRPEDADPRAVSREHQCPLALHLLESEAQGHAGVSGGAERVAAGHLGGAYCGRHVRRPSPASLSPYDRAPASQTPATASSFLPRRNDAGRYSSPRFT